MHNRLVHVGSDPPKHMPSAGMLSPAGIGGVDDLAAALSGVSEPLLMSRAALKHFGDAQYYAGQESNWHTVYEFGRRDRGPAMICACLFGLLVGLVVGAYL